MYRKKLFNTMALSTYFKDTEINEENLYSADSSNVVTVPNGPIISAIDKTGI